jgi:hypothetical protein
MMTDNDIEILASWLNGAARDTRRRGHEDLRRIVSYAAKTANEMYGTDETDDGTDDKIPAVIARFAAALDEDERLRKEMER